MLCQLGIAELVRKSGGQLSVLIGELAIAELARKLGRLLQQLGASVGMLGNGRVCA